MTPDRLPFRPLDNSSPTRLGYNIEVQQWLTSIKSAQASTTSGLSALGLIGFFIGIFVNIVLILIMLILMFFEWILKPKTDKDSEFTKYPHKSKYFDAPDDNLRNSF